MVRWRFFTAQGDWRSMMLKGRISNQKSKPPSNTLREGRAGKWLRATALRYFPAHEKSGQFICYRTGHFYLLLTINYLEKL